MCIARSRRVEEEFKDRLGTRRRKNRTSRPLSSSKCFIKASVPCSCCSYFRMCLFLYCFACSHQYWIPCYVCLLVLSFIILVACVGCHVKGSMSLALLSWLGGFNVNLINVIWNCWEPLWLWGIFGSWGLSKWTVWAGAEDARDFGMVLVLLEPAKDLLLS